ncbi:cuticle-tanning hormone bursicon [Brevipalpus obovatus]|uniref:cuticle-tanning hormone bursicon n=1 Tax=Brevipalpus obovatus TaxID=246614 RepID=UPI003D9F742F
MLPIPSLFLLFLTMFINISDVSSKGCQLRPVIHVLNHQGCIAKSVPSFACHGTCSSYVQISGSKFWQVERSCMCCQEMGEREAFVSLFCPGNVSKFRKIKTKAPIDCMCRPCSGILDINSIKAHELLDMERENRQVDGGSDFI